MMDTPTDDHTLDEIRAALAAADPVPDDVLATARASFTWRTVDAELAALAYDSANEELAGIRGEAGERQLTFRAPGLEIEVLIGGEDRRLTGQLVPPHPATLELRAGEETIEAAAGADGVFSFVGVPTGPVSLRCVLAGGAGTVETAWQIL